MEYTGETCEYFAVSKKGCKLDGERVSSTQVDSFTPNPDQGARVKGIKLVGLATVEKVAQELANTFNKPVAICLRGPEAQNSALVPFINRFTDDPELETSSIIKTVLPAAAHEPSVQQAVEAALAQLSPEEQGATQRYFGLDGATPEQDPGEAQRSMELVDQLREECNKLDGDVSDVLGKIADHAGNSGFDTEILRALRKRGNS